MDKFYWNEFGLLRANNYENDQNGLLRAAYYHYGVGDVPLGRIEKSLCIMDDRGRYAQHPENTWEGDRASHDELTAILYFWTVLENPYKIQDIKIGYYLKYPQVLFFLLSCQHTWFWPFRFMCGLWMLGGVWKKERAKNGRWDTDSELLSLLKIAVFKMIGVSLPFRKKIESKILRNWGVGTDPVNLRSRWPHLSFPVLIKSMLHYDENHPLRKDMFN